MRFHVVLIAFLLQQIGNQSHAVGEDMDIDVRAFAHMPGHDAADQARTKSPKKTHQAQRLQPHVAEVLRAFFTFMDAGKDLNLLADLGIGGKIRGFDALAAQAFGRLAFGRVVFRFDAFVHQPGGLLSDCLAKSEIGHPFMRRNQAHRAARGYENESHNSILLCRRLARRGQ